MVKTAKRNRSSKCKELKDKRKSKLIMSRHRKRQRIEFGLARAHDDREDASVNLNTLFPKDYSTPELIMRRHYDAISMLIQEYSRPGRFIVGCVAWFTNRAILSLLKDAQEKGALVQFVVNKDSFIRSSRNPVRRQYDQFSKLSKQELKLVQGRDRLPPRVQKAFRCCGAILRGKAKMHEPRMHHKFAVFGVLEEKNTKMKPETAYMGSFNWTRNAMRSLESAMIIKDERNVKSLLYEFQQVARGSESIQYTSRSIKC